MELFTDQGIVVGVYTLHWQISAAFGSWNLIRTTSHQHLLHRSLNNMSWNQRCWIRTCKWEAADWSLTRNTPGIGWNRYVCLVVLDLLDHVTIAMFVFELWFLSSQESIWMLRLGKNRPPHPADNLYSWCRPPLILTFRITVYQCFVSLWPFPCSFFIN